MDDSQLLKSESEDGMELYALTTRAPVPCGIAEAKNVMMSLRSVGNNSYTVGLAKVPSGFKTGVTGGGNASINPSIDKSSCGSVLNWAKPEIVLASDGSITFGSSVLTGTI